MALFKISKGLKTNLPSSKTDGWCYFTTDDGKFWIDYKDTDNALKRKAVNAAYADTATKATSDGSGNNIVNTYATKAALKSVSDLVGSTSVSSQITNAITSKADKTHTHNYAGSSSAGGSANSAVKLDSSAGDANTPVYFSGGKPAACTSLDLDTSGNAATATKLKTARTIGLGTGATGTATSFDGSGNITIPVTSVKEAYLDWGGRNISGGVTPVGASLSAEHSANRLAYLNPNAITVEYSDNAGSTWNNYNISNENKIGFVTTSTSIPIGYASTVTTNHRTRITITAQDGTNGYVYTRPRKMLLNVSSAGHGISVTVETKTGASGANWSVVGTYSLSGWSGWNDIPLGFSTLGGGKTQTSNIWYMRLTFATTSVLSSYTTTKSSILGIRLFGDTCWTKTSNMGETGHLYSYDIAQNATFPAKVTATSFKGSLEGNATSASKVTNALTIQGNGTTLTNGTYDGSASKTVNITPGSIGAAASNHTHNYAGSSSAGGAANSVANSMTVQLNGGTTEGTNKFTFNGSAAKSVNITPSGIGAAAASHGTHVSYGTTTQALGTASPGSATTVSRSDHVHKMPSYTDVGAAAASHSHSQYELLTNKINQWTASSPSETAYPTEKLVKTALDGKANTGQKTTNSAGGHSHSLTIPVASITTEGTAASYTGHSFTAGSGSFTASVDANGVLSFSHTHKASSHSAGTFSANKPTKISITNTDYTTNSTGGHTHNITI